MRVITVKNIALQFDADQITQGTPKQQARQAVDMINGVLQREPYGFAAQILEGDNNLDIEVEKIEDEGGQDEN